MKISRIMSGNSREKNTRLTKVKLKSEALKNFEGNSNEVSNWCQRMMIYYISIIYQQPKNNQLMGKNRIYSKQDQGWQG